MEQWIVVGDASGVRIFSTKGRMDRLELVKEIANPTGRMRTQELVTDEPGRVFHAGNAGSRSAAEPRTTAHDEAAIEFARSIDRVLHSALEKKSYSSVSLVAPPHFLGLLRSMLSKQVTQHIHNTLAKDLVGVSVQELGAHLEPLQYAGK